MWGRIYVERVNLVKRVKLDTGRDYGGQNGRYKSLDR